MIQRFRKLVLVGLILIYLIILAGAVVRMTGSGMGCPDWPKCFGYYIPPTQLEQVQWKPNTVYTKGAFIVHQNSLYTAKTAFTTTTQYVAQNWSAYTKHNYSHFNALHTWIEYINRLVTALSGIPILLIFLWSWRFYSKDKRIAWLSLTVVIAMLVQAVLGKIVVDTNLLPWRITVHMLVAFIILAQMIYIYHLACRCTTLLLDQENLMLKHNCRIPVKSYKKMYYGLVVALLLTLIQVVLGTQVRQFVDYQIKSLATQDNPSLWLANPTVSFYIHRSFSILVFLVNVYLFSLVRKEGIAQLYVVRAVLVLILMEIFTGILMYYFAFPFLTQPLHLVFASFLFGAQFLWWVRLEEG